MSEFAAFDPRPRDRIADPAAGWTIRPATPDDVPALARITAAREGTPFDDAALASAERVVAKSHDPSRALCLVAARGDAVVGLGKAAVFASPEPYPPKTSPAGWYLTGVIVQPESRRLGIARELTRLRLLHIAERADAAWYFANERNLASIALHETFGFDEFTRDFEHPGVRFEGGCGILFRCDLVRHRPKAFP